MSSFENFFSEKTSIELFISFENCGKHWKEAIKARVIDVKIRSLGYAIKVFNYKNFKSDK